MDLTTTSYTIWKAIPDRCRNLASDPQYQPVVEEMYRRIWTFGLAHEEHLLNEYIVTAMADYGPGIVVGR